MKILVLHDDIVGAMAHPGVLPPGMKIVWMSLNLVATEKLNPDAPMYGCFKNGNKRSCEHSELTEMVEWCDEIHFAVSRKSELMVMGTGKNKMAISVLREVGNRYFVTIPILKPYRIFDYPKNRSKKITLIGSTQYRDKFESHKLELEAAGHEVRIPAFDDHGGLDELGVCEHNRNLIEWADEIHLIWDQRSMGTIFDFGMAFMARKPIKIIYMEPKTFRGVMEKYEAECLKSVDS